MSHPNAPRTVIVRLTPARVVAARMSTRTARQLAAFLFVIAALTASMLAGPDADATTVPSSSAGHAAYRAALSVVLPVCEYEDSSDCRQEAGDWTAVRVGGGMVWVDFSDPNMTDYLTPDAYPPADS